MPGTNLFAPSTIANDTPCLVDENGFDYVTKRVITLTSAQILALNTTPIQLVEAHGAGTVVVINKLLAKLVYGSAAYTGANALEIRYTDGSGAKATADLPTSFLNATANAYYKAIEASAAPVENAKVVAVVPTANPGAGNSPIIIEIEYAVRKLS